MGKHSFIFNSRRMRKFIRKTIEFHLLLLVSICIYFYIFETKSDLRDLWGYETYHSIAKAKSSTKKVKKLILGDSVANQSYNNETYNDSIYSLACNQGVSQVGHYVLLKTFLEQNNDNTDLEVFLINRPSSFNNNLDQPFTFNNFLKPFYKEEFYRHFSSSVLKKIKEVSFYYLVHIPWVRSSRWAPKYAVKKNYLAFRLADVSIEYLRKMEELCIEYGVKSFTLYCPFLSDKYGPSDLEILNKQIKEANLEHLFVHYYDYLLYIDQSKLSDDIHLDNPAKDLPPNYLNL